MEIKLFKQNKLGKIQEWIIEVHSNRFRTIEGLQDGKKTTSKWTECYPKNIGKSNETTAEQQAILIAERKAEIKKEQGYVSSMKDIDNTQTKPFEPMLAHKWDGVYTDSMIVQPKLDGMRCIVTKDGMFSRNGKQIYSAPHIYKLLLPLFLDHKNLVLDGELYNHGFKNDFNKIISLARKTKPTKDNLKESEELLQYHIYDCSNLQKKDLNFIDRYMWLYEAIKPYLNKNIKLVETLLYEGVKKEIIDNQYISYLNQGYEGMMFRLNKPYENERSKSLLKRKDFIDEEFEILDILEGVGNRSGMMGRACFKTKEGRQFTASSKGNEEYFTELLRNKEKYIGKLATVRFQNMTPDGSPRFPVMVSIRDYE